LKSGDTSKADRASSKINAKYIIEDGDILFSWSATLEVEHWTSGQGALNQHLFKVTGEKVPSWFAYFSTKASLETFRAIASEKATSMGHIQRRHLSDEKYAIPTEEFISNISETFDSLLNQKILLLTQCRSLTNLRDSLLRRLISGELQISEEILVS
jgi:type I restriction enzyme S subunit